MKNILLFSLSILFTLSMYSQEIEQDNNNEKQNDEIRTIFDKVKIIGYSLGISARYGEKYDLQTWDLGLNGGMIVNHWLGIGIALYGLSQEAIYEIDLEDDYAIEAFYGGVYFEAILLGKFPIHVSFPVLVGGGGYSFETSDYYNSNNWNSNNNNYYSFWLIKPGAEIQLNMFKRLRVNLGAYYRFTTGLNNYYRPNDAINGFSFGLTLQIGKF